METQAFWQNTEYFRNFDEFDSSAVYIPTFLLEHLVKVDFSPISDVTVVELFSILSVLLKFSFKPIDKNVPPRGYINFTVKKISGLAKINKETVSIGIRRLIEYGVVGNKDDYLWIRHPKKWLLPLSGKRSNGFDTDQISTLLRLF